MVSNGLSVGGLNDILALKSCVLKIFRMKYSLLKKRKCLEK